MRYKLIAFSLPFVFAAKAFAAPGGLACDWVDKEALVALGLDNTVPKVAPQGTGAIEEHQCTFSAANAPIPSLNVSVKPAADNLTLEPVCQWTDFQQPNASDLGFCFMKIGHSYVSLTLMVASSSASTLQSTMKSQAERLFNKHLESAPK